MTLYLILASIAGAGTGFILFYKFYWSHRIDREEVKEILIKAGIGDRPETIVKNYYQNIQHENLDEKKVRSLTRQFTENNKEFFLTMYDLTKKHQENKT